MVYTLLQKWHWLEAYQMEALLRLKYLLHETLHSLALLQSSNQTTRSSASRQQELASLQWLVDNFLIWKMKVRMCYHIWQRRRSPAGEIHTSAFSNDPMTEAKKLRSFYPNGIGWYSIGYYDKSLFMHLLIHFLYYCNMFGYCDKSLIMTLLPFPNNVTTFDFYCSSIPY